MLQANDRFTVTKGLNSWPFLNKGDKGTVYRIDEMEGRSARVILQLDKRPSGPNSCFYVRHVNRLADPTIRMNTGDPTKVLIIKKGRKP